MKDAKFPPATIVGAGPAGSLLGIFLARRGIDSCDPAHLEAMRQVNFSTTPIKEVSIVDPDGIDDHRLGVQPGVSWLALLDGPAVRAVPGVRGSASAALEEFGRFENEIYAHAASSGPVKGLDDRRHVVGGVADKHYALLSPINHLSDDLRGEPHGSAWGVGPSDDDVDGGRRSDPLAGQGRL